MSSRAGLGGEANEERLKVASLRFGKAPRLKRWDGSVTNR
jgi:hypothetical protein